MQLRKNSAAAVSAMVVLLVGVLSECQALPGKAYRYGEPRELAKLKDARINESSGIAVSIRNRDAFWTHNDSGDSARIFLVSKSGETLAMANIKGVTAVDWEDIATYRLGEESYVLIADVGDNARRRNDCVLYIIREPEIAAASGGSEAVVLDIEPVSAIHFAYEDGAHDCEGVAVDPTESTVYLVSKALSECKVYTIPIPSKDSKETSVAKAIAALKLPYVNGMDISPDGRHAVMMTYGNAYEFARDTGDAWTNAFSLEPSVIKTPVRKQGESVCYGSDGKTLYLTSENPFQPLWEIPVSEDPR